LDAVTWMVKPDRIVAALTVAAVYPGLGAALTTSRRLLLPLAGSRLNTAGS
jgi:hypothetical protein